MPLKQIHKRVKPKILLALLAIIVFSIILFYQNTKESFKYFYSDCRIYERSGHIVHMVPGYQFCSYHPDGMILATNSMEQKLTLFDKDDTVIWTSSEFAHHDLKFSKDLSFLIMISSVTEKKENGVVRSDCVSKRDYKNNTLAEWCLKDHLKELEVFGFKTWNTTFQKWIRQEFDSEISHANSVYEIEDNESAKENSAFSKGNFIVNLYGPSKLVIVLDSRLKTVLWSKNFSDYFCKKNECYVHSHDLQILKNGNILAYVNMIEYSMTQDVKNFYCLFHLNFGMFYFRYFVPRNHIHSFLAEINPINNNVVWQYEENPESNFKAFANGSVTKIGDHYAYSNNTFGGHLVEMTSSGKIISVTENAIRNEIRNLPFDFTKPKPFIDKSFLKSRGLVD
jgi:hypothetical protein